MPRRERSRTPRSEAGPPPGTHSCGTSMALVMFCLGGGFFFIIIFYFFPREEADWASRGTAGSASGAEAARALKLPFFFCLFLIQDNTAVLVTKH